MKEITYLVIEIQMDEIIHTNCAATAPSIFHSLLREESAHTMASEGRNLEFSPEGGW